MNTRFERRRFLRGLGLGAGASLLLPVGDRLLRRAHGADEPIIKRAIIMSVYMMERPNYRPAEFVEGTGAVGPVEVAQWPQMYEPLDAYLDRAVVVDGARNYISTHQHRAGTSALSCRSPAVGRAEGMGPAGGITIDQFLAGTLSQDAPYKSVLWGLTGDGMRAEQDTASGVFAAGEQANLSHFHHARALMEQLFPESEPDAPPVSEGSSFRPLRDRLLEDIRRLGDRLAPSERLALESYEEAIVDFDRRQDALAAIQCDGPGHVAMEEDPQANLESMMDQTALALKCGLTNVVGITIGTSMNHNKHMPAYREVAARSSDPEVVESGQARYYNHGFGVPELYQEAKRHFHQLHFKELARVLDILAATPESDGSSVLDHTAVLYVTGNGDSRAGHHAGDNSIWPGVLIAGGRTGFDTRGRYLRLAHGKNDEHRNLSDLYRSVALGLGVDPTGFNDDARDAQGSISEILR